MISLREYNYKYIKHFSLSESSLCVQEFYYGRVLKSKYALLIFKVRYKKKNGTLN